MGGAFYLISSTLCLSFVSDSNIIFYLPMAEKNTDATQCNQKYSNWVFLL